jgi:hypothetical protein
MSQVYLRDHDGTYWPIPYNDRRLPAVTLSELCAASRRLRASGEKSVTQRRILASIDEQRPLVRWSSKRPAKKPGHGASRSGRGVRCSGPAMVQSTQSDEVNRHRSTRILALFFLLQSRNGRDRSRASRCCISRCRGFAG